MKENLTLRLLALVFTTFFLANFVQSKDKPDEKKKIKVQLLVAGKPILPNQVLGKNEIEIGVKVFPFDAQDLKEKKELVVTDFDIALIHNGRKIAEKNILGQGSIASLASLAKNDDMYSVQIKEVYEKTKDGNLKSYAKGMMRLNYLFFDTKLALK